MKSLVITALAEFIPDELTTITLSADVDAENTLRGAVLDFVDIVRGVEKTIAAARRGDRPLAGRPGEGPGAGHASRRRSAAADDVDV